MERYELDVFSEEIPQQKTEQPSDDESLAAAAKRASKKTMAMQATLFQTANEQLLDELRDLKIEEVSPDELKKIIEDFQKRIV